MTPVIDRVSGSDSSYATPGSICPSGPTTRLPLQKSTGGKCHILNHRSPDDYRCSPVIENADQSIIRSSAQIDPNTEPGQ